MSQSKENRRSFLKTSVAATAAASAPYFYSQPKTLADEIKSKNDRVTLGVIGAGGMANGNMQIRQELGRCGCDRRR